MSSSGGTSLDLPPPPIFGVAAAEKGTTKSGGILSLDDIFDEFLFSGERPHSRAPAGSSRSVLDRADDMNDDDDDDDDSDDDGYDDDSDGRKKKRARGGIQRNMTEEQKVERRYV